MRKDYILIGIVSFFVFLGVIYGFSVVGLPRNSRAIRIDSQRRNDLSSIKYRIENYYSTNNKLPGYIQEAVMDDSYVKILDPETNKPYEYYVIGSNSYKLCATFKTKYPSGNPSRVSNYSYSSNFYHDKGYYCFSFDVKTSQYKYNYLTPSPINPLIKFEDNNIQDVTTSTPYDQSSKFPEGFFNSSINDNGLVNYRSQNVYVTVNFIKPVKLSEITNTFAECNIPSCDNYNGTFFFSVEGETEDYQRISLGNNLKPADTGMISKIIVTTDKEFKKMTFRTYGPLIWKKMKFIYK